MAAQQAPKLEPKQRVRAVRELAKQGSETIPGQEYLSDPVVEVRVEAVKTIVEIGTQRSLDPLIQATRDTDAEVQIRATDGLVNFDVPGYVQTGVTATLKRAGDAVTSRWTDTNDQVIESFIQVRAEVIEALGDSPTAESRWKPAPTRPRAGHAARARGHPRAARSAAD